jgi:hypothetical protein
MGFFFLRYWKLIVAGIVIAGLGAAVLWYRSAAAVAELKVAQQQAKLAEWAGAYEILTVKLEEQNAAVMRVEEESRRAVDKGRQARAEAQDAVDVARKSAEALGRVLTSPRPTVDCPESEAIKAVRADLGTGAGR